MDGHSRKTTHSYPIWNEFTFGVDGDLQVKASTDNGEATTYATHETFWGPLKALMPFKQIDLGFKEQTNQLKRYCEETAPTAPTQVPS